MSGSPGAPLRLRLLAEGLMIVASVLSALALDGWIAERGERRAEAEYRTLLRAEFLQNLEEVEADRAEGNLVAIRMDHTDTSQRFSGGLARILAALTERPAPPAES